VLFLFHESSPAWHDVEGGHRDDISRMTNIIDLVISDERKKLA